MNIHKNTRLTEVQRKRVWRLHSQGRKPRDLAVEFHVSHVTIYKIIKRARLQEFRPRNSMNHRYRNVEWWLKRLRKIEDKLREKKNKEAQRYNKKYPGEMMHMDTKRLPAIKNDPDKSPEYLFVWIDDYSRELYVRITWDKTQVSSAQFLDQVSQECPYVVEKILTDNGKEYKGTSDHAFVKLCEQLTITQAFTRVKRPQTNGKAERVIRTLMDMWHSKHQFKTREERHISLKRFVNWYNTVKPHKWIENKTPYEMIEEFYYWPGWLYW